MADISAERVAHNDDVFRRANEQIQDVADQHAFDGPIPFLCECPDESCTEIVRLTREQYAEVRADARRFVHAPGHWQNADGHERVVAERDGYDVAEKIGRAAEIAEELAE